MIDLIPGAKYPLAIATAVLPAPGVWAPDSPLPLNAIGALVTPPLGWNWDGEAAPLRPRPGALVWEPPRRPLERFLERLTRLRDQRPRIITLAADRSGPLTEAVALIEGEAEAAALLVWWRPGYPPSETLAAARAATPQLLLAELPADLAVEYLPDVVDAGVDALVIGPPRALFEGGAPARLWGPAVLPAVERALDLVADTGLALPLIAAAGVASSEDGLRLCEAGAAAVALGPEWWVRPELAREVAEALAD